LCWSFCNCELHVPIAAQRSSVFDVVFDVVPRVKHSVARIYSFVSFERERLFVV
jgi:hypothetical protein